MMKYFIDQKDVFKSFLIILFSNSRHNEDKPDITKRSFKDCTPRKKVAFLKTHKCASTTIQNILLRFGRNNNLNFVLPSKGHLLGTNVPFRRNMIQGTLWEKAGLEYDMFLLHSIWNHREISNTLSDHGDTFSSSPKVYFQL